MLGLLNIFMGVYGLTKAVQISTAKAEVEEDSDEDDEDDDLDNIISPY